MWGGGEYELLAEKLAPAHERLVAALDPRPGVRWLDLATGTGAVAVRARDAGADVVGVDISERLLEQARAKASDVDWRLADIQTLPLATGSFDVVSCCFGVMFPPDADAVAGELARVCRAGGRLGVTTWVPVQRLTRIFERYVREYPPGLDLWGEEESVRRLLGEAFELQISRETWALEGASPEAVWDEHIRAAPPARAFYAGLDEPTRAAYREDMLAYWRDTADSQGRVREDREYLLVVGTRR